MPNYEYHCGPCGALITKFNQGAPPRYPPNCPECGSLPRRKYGFSTPHPDSTFQTHFNNSVGKVVSSQRQFNDELKRAGDKASERTGIPHNYVARDPRDRVGVTEEGLYEGAKAFSDLTKDK